MRISGNTILVTGHNAGIGRAFAEELCRRDIADGASIPVFARDLVQRFPELGTVVHMAGIMQTRKSGAGSTSQSSEAMMAARKAEWDKIG